MSSMRMDLEHIDFYPNKLYIDAMIVLIHYILLYLGHEMLKSIKNNIINEIKWIYIIFFLF